MITLPAEIALDDDWNGTSVNNGVTNLNVESLMGPGEHKAIVLAAGALLAGNPQFAANAAGAYLTHLKNAYHSSDPGYKLYVYKGIHMPYSDPHITLALHHTDLNNEKSIYKFHLQVSVTDTAFNDEHSDRFHWRGVWFSAIVNGVTEKWPAGATCVCKDGRERYRRHSITESGLIELRESIRSETLRREAQAELDKSKNKVLAKLKALNYTLVSKKDLAKLLAGEPVAVTTMTRKTIQVRKASDTGNIVNV